MRQAFLGAAALPVALLMPTSQAHAQFVCNAPNAPKSCGDESAEPPQEKSNYSVPVEAPTEVPSNSVPTQAPISLSEVDPYHDPECERAMSNAMVSGNGAVVGRGLFRKTGDGRCYNITKVKVMYRGF